MIKMYDRFIGAVGNAVERFWNFFVRHALYVYIVLALILIIGALT
jgi:hypothetical protein